MGVARTREASSRRDPSCTKRTRRPVRETAFWQAYHRSRYAILFYALLLTLLAMPMAATIGLPAILVRLLVGVCLLAAVMPNSSRRNRRILFTGVALLVFGRMASDGNFLPLNPGLFLALVGVTGLAAAAGALRFLIRSKVVDHETIYAALSAYLLAGLFFGQIYWSIDLMRPNSLVGPDALSELGTVYFSFVTLASLGYGDILPRTDIARGLAIFEVIGGQLFLAVMVARLVGLFVSTKADR